MYGRALYSLIIALMLTPTICAAQVTPPVSPTSPDAKDTARAAFVQLSQYLRGNPLDFKTSFVSQNLSLGNSRGSAHFVIERPNLLRVEVSAPNFSYLLISDGAVYTIYDQNKGKYAQVTAPKSPLGALNLFTGLSAFEAQVLRFFGVVHDVASGGPGIQVSTDGSSLIGGRQCDHFTIAYTTGVFPDKWEAWLERSGVPLPCKSVVTSADDTVVQTNEYDWTLNATLSPDTFVFTPPKGSQKVDIGELGLQPPH